MVLMNVLKNPYQEAKTRFGTTTPAEQALICLNRIEILEEKFRNLEAGFKNADQALNKVMDVLVEPEGPEEPKYPLRKKTKNAKVS